VFCAQFLNAADAHAALEAQPLPRAHAHNDYHHPRPLLDALDHGFCSVEADIFLVGDQLLVGHLPLELKPARTLQALYLDPLRRRVQDHGGRVYRDGPPFTLLVDVKTDAERTYAVLATALAGYAEMLTSVRDGVVEPRAVNVIISGNRAEQAVADARLRYVGVDGRLGDLDTPRPSHLVPLISDNWRSHFRWLGQGPMPEPERQKLRGIVDQAHATGRRVRFWATPDDPAVWRELADAGVDLLNADDLAGLVRFLRALQPAERGTVRGRVTGDGRPLAGVLVSDGCRVVATDTQGQYALPIGGDSGPFVFVTTPRGYWTERFYQPLSQPPRPENVNFDLQARDQPDRFDFVFLADVHLERSGPSLAKFQASLDEINRLDPQPAFILSQGDICLQGGAGPQYVEGLKTARIPIRHGPGNHEMLLKHDNPRDEYQQLFGPTYYSFDWGPAHIVVLDGNKPLPGQDGWQAVHGAVEGRELEWLRADLAAQPQGKPIIVGVHIPIASTYPERRQHSPDNAPYWEMTNHRILTELLAQSGVRLVLQGHMHENERITVGGVEYVESISLSGSWWKAGTGLERGVDGSPRGYRIVRVDGANVTHRYRSSCESCVDRQGEWYPSGKPAAEAATRRFVFNCYDAPNGSTAEGRVDDGPWQPMPAYPLNSKPTPDLAMPHHYQLTIDKSKLAPGEHTLAARVTWPDGTVVQESQRFVNGP
jgi:UDP-2,3-diacylglucosamine pyrophosphatase LpxH